MVVFQTFQIVPIIVDLGDFLYFLIQRNVILSTDWTCQIVGCLKIVGVNITDLVFHFYCHDLCYNEVNKKIF